MAGGLLNLVAVGNQNVILNGNPQKTFFTSTYKKYTNFGMQKLCEDSGMLLEAVRKDHEIVDNKTVDFFSGRGYFCFFRNHIFKIQLFLIRFSIARFVHFSRQFESKRSTK